LVDQLAGERGRDVGARLVVLDQELDLLAEDAALLVDLVRAEDQALGRRLRIGLRYADAVGDHADLDGVLRLRGKPNQHRGEQCEKSHLPLLSRLSAASASSRYRFRAPASKAPAAPDSNGSRP